MQTIDMTAKVEKFIRYGLICVLVPALVIGYAEFKYWHKSETLTLPEAKVAGTMVSVRVLANGKVKELLFKDGDEVKAGDVIARLEVSITPEEIKQLENSVQLAKDHYAKLQQGQWVSVPVQRERIIPATPSSSSKTTPPANLAKLEERANRMAELFEMGAVSAVQRDAARRAYEQARSQPAPSYSGGTESRVEHYTEYVQEFRPTPAAVLAGAEQAVKQAELTLNVALQEARQTEVIAPVNGIIFYGAEVDKDLSAGDSVAKIGDSGELWIEAEVSEEVFNKIPLGKLVSYSIDGKQIVGTVIEKRKPDPKPAPVELPEIPATENQPPAPIGDKPAADVQQPANPTTPAADAQQPANPTQQGQPPKLPEADAEKPKPNDKFIIKISLPVERDFNCKPNTTTAIKINLA